MKLLATVALTLALMTLAVNADDQKIDLSSMTCAQFAQSDQARINLILTWFVGFYSDVGDPQVINLTKLEEARARFLTLCKEQPDFRLMAAADGILGK